MCPPQADWGRQTLVPSRGKKQASFRRIRPTGFLRQMRNLRQDIDFTRISAGRTGHHILSGVSRRIRMRSALALAGAVSLLGASQAQALDAFEIQVYDGTADAPGK